MLRSILSRGSSTTSRCALASRSSSSSRALTQRRGMAQMPVPRSSQAKPFEGHPTHNEGWESTIAWVYPVSFVMIIGILTCAPETEISAWAQKEAQARLDLKGKTEIVFGKHYQDLTKEEIKEEWDRFSMKSTRMTDDDEDEEEDDDDEY